MACLSLANVGGALWFRSTEAENEDSRLSCPWMRLPVKWMWDETPQNQWLEFVFLCIRCKIMLHKSASHPIEMAIMGLDFCRMYYYIINNNSNCRNTSQDGGHHLLKAAGGKAQAKWHACVSIYQHCEVSAGWMEWHLQITLAQV